MIGYLRGSVTSSSKKSRELMTVNMACDEASEESKFLSALNASLEHFVHKTLKAEQVECIHRIVWHGSERYVGRVTNEIRQERHLSVDSKSVV